MERVGLFFKLKEGRAGDYKKAHDDIWDEMKAVLDDSGISNYSIWNLGDMLFSYFEVEDRERMESVFSHSAVYQKWRNYMEDFVYVEPDTGQKEWYMNMVFYKK